MSDRATCLSSEHANGRRRRVRAPLCADHVVANGVRSADIELLAALYDSAQDPARAKAHLLLRDLGVRIGQSKYLASFPEGDRVAPEARARAESIATRLDELPRAVSDLKLIGHRKLLADSKASLDHAHTAWHARRVIALGGEIRPRTVVVDGYVTGATADLAQTFGDSGLVDSALAVLADARRDVGNTSAERATLESMRARYSMVGHPAPPIVAAHWLNAAAQPALHSISGTGKVTIIQFTGVACAPCRASYPALTALYERLDRARFDMVFSTALSGMFEGTKMTPANELAATRDYYVNRHKLRFPIAVADAPPAPDPRGLAVSLERPSADRRRRQERRRPTHHARLGLDECPAARAPRGGTDRRAVRSRAILAILVS